MMTDPPHGKLTSDPGIQYGRRSKDPEIRYGRLFNDPDIQHGKLSSDLEIQYDRRSKDPGIRYGRPSKDPEIQHGELSEDPEILHGELLKDPEILHGELSKDSEILHGKLSKDQRLSNLRLRMKEPGPSYLHIRAKNHTKNRFPFRKVLLKILVGVGANSINILRFINRYLEKNEKNEKNEKRSSNKFFDFLSDFRPVSKSAHKALENKYEISERDLETQKKLNEVLRKSLIIITKARTHTMKDDAGEIFSHTKQLIKNYPGPMPINMLIWVTSLLGAYILMIKARGRSDSVLGCRSSSHAGRGSVLDVRLPSRARAPPFRSISEKVARFVLDKIGRQPQPVDVVSE